MRFGIWCQASVFIVFVAFISPSLGQPSDDRFPSRSAPAEPQTASQPSKKPRSVPAKKNITSSKKEGIKAIEHSNTKGVVKSREQAKSPAKAAKPLAVSQPAPLAPAPPTTPSPRPPTGPATTAPGARPPAGSAPTAVSPAAPPAKKAEEVFAICLACHGSHGHSETSAIPSIAAQPGPFVIKQLALFRDGKHKSPLMDSVIGLLDEESARRYSEIILKLPKPDAPLTGFNSSRYEQGKSVAAAANCANCHNADFAGAGDNPELRTSAGGLSPQGTA